MSRRNPPQIPWGTVAVVGGGLLVGLPLLKAASVPRYTSGPLKGKVNLAALYGKEYAAIAARNGYWSVAAGDPLYSYNARLTPAEADSLVKSWEERVAVIDREQSSAWKRWKASFIEKYGAYGRELDGLVSAMQQNAISAAQAFASGQTTDKRYLQAARSCPTGQGHFKGWLGPRPILSCFMPLAGLVHADGKSLAGGATTPGKFYSFAYSSKIWHQLRTLAQALSTWEITAETAPQPRFSDELPPVLSQIARAGECLAEKECREKYALKIPQFPDLGAGINTAIRYTVYAGLAYVGYKLYTGRRDAR